MKKLQGSTQLEKFQKLADQADWTKDPKHPIYTGRFWIRNKRRFGSYEEWKYAESAPMWDHYCKAERSPMSIGKGEECNWCGAVE